MPQHHNLRRYALLLQIILVTQFALAFLRVFATSGMWGFQRFYIFNLRYIPAGVFALIILTALSPWLLLKRIHSSRISHWWALVGIGLGILRIAEQLTHNAIGDYFLANGGIILFILYFSIIYQTARSQKWVCGNMVTTGIAIAIMLDTALRGALWTLDLSWQPGLWPIIVVTILSVTLAALSFVIKPKNGQTLTSPKRPLAWSIILIGFYFFFAQHLFGDISRISQNTGWKPETSLFFLLAGNLLGVLGTYWRVTYKKKSLRLLPWLFFLGAIAVTLGARGWQYVIALYLVEITNNIMITIVLSTVFSAPGDKNILRTKKIYLLNFVTYILLLITFYTTGMSDMVFIIIGIIVAEIFWKTISVNASLPVLTPSHHKAWIGVFIVLLLPLVFIPLNVKRNQLAIDPLIIPPNGSINVMHWNIHQGIDAYGKLSLPQQAAFIRENDVDIVSLNEVNRGTLWSGGTDALLWLSHELGMYAAYGPAIGHMSGNAFLSRIPFEKIETKLYSVQTTIFPSGCITVDVSLGSQVLHLTSTHVLWSNIDLAKKDFENRNTGNLPERVKLFHDLVSACVNVSEPYLLLGDMNAKPETAAIQVLRTAGLTDAAEANLAGDTFTWPNPLQRIDYVFGSQEINFESYQVTPGTISDHFPIGVSLSLQDKLTNKENSNLTNFP